MKNFLEKIKSLIEKVKTYFKNFSNLSTKDKIKVLLQWPALCCSTFIFLFFLVVLIVNCVKPYSNSPYVYEETIGNYNINIEMRLEPNGIATMETVMKNADHKQYQKEDVYYEVVNGELIYSYTRNSYEKNKMGKINAFEITITEGETSITLTNHGEETARAFYIVFMLIGIAGAGASGFYIYWKNYKKPTGKTKNTEKNLSENEPLNKSEDADDELDRAGEPVIV